MAAPLHVNLNSPDWKDKLAMLCDVDPWANALDLLLEVDGNVVGCAFRMRSKAPHRRKPVAVPALTSTQDFSDRSFERLTEGLEYLRTRQQTPRNIVERYVGKHKEVTITKKVPAAFLDDSLFIDMYTANSFLAQRLSRFSEESFAAMKDGTHWLRYRCAHQYFESLTTQFSNLAGDDSIPSITEHMTGAKPILQVLNFNSYLKPHLFTTPADYTHFLLGYKDIGASIDEVHEVARDCLQDEATYRKAVERFNDTISGLKYKRTPPLSRRHIFGEDITVSALDDCYTNVKQNMACRKPIELSTALLDFGFLVRRRSADSPPFSFALTKIKRAKSSQLELYDKTPIDKEIAGLFYMR